MDNYADKLQQILDVGILLTSEKNPDCLLDTIMNTAMNLTNSDGGTLYQVDENHLVFRIMKTKSKNVDLGKNGGKISIPPVEIRKENICGYAALTKQSLNIENVYESELFDFSGPKKYDAMNEYHTQSMVAIPMIDEAGEVIGVMQLINAMDDKGCIRAYTEDEVKILLSLASQTAISLTNASYLEEINRQIWSFTEALTEAIDARTPYNANHTRKVAEYAGMLVDHINLLYLQGEETDFFDKEHKDQVVMAAFLHDIGKMIIPIEVMNKQTRLGDGLEKICDRMQLIRLYSEVDMLKGNISEKEREEILAHANQTEELAKKVDGAGFLDDALLAGVKELFDYEYVSPDRSIIIPFLTEQEKEYMLIRKGTLTDEERDIMNSHVLMTERILSKVYFNKKFANAPMWATQHHEMIDGSGYPNAVGGDKLGVEARILAVADICDALLATDRPYKKPMPKEKAFAIMESMADEGKLEARLVKYLKDII